MRKTTTKAKRQTKVTKKSTMKSTLNTRKSLSVSSQIQSNTNKIRTMKKSRMRTMSSAKSTISFTFKDSSFIKGFRWVANPKNPTVGNLTVFMKDDSRYLYRNIDKQTIRNWRRRQSAGTFFVKYIKEIKSERV
jgi:hypothetical protein